MPQPREWVVDPMLRPGLSAMMTTLRHEEVPVEPIDQLDAVVPTLGDLVKGVRPDQLAAPTPCDEFTVRDLLGHFVGNVDRISDGFRGEAITDLAPRPEMLGDDPGKTYDAVTADFGSRVREPGAMERTISLPPPFGEVPAPVLVRFVAFDFMMHSWDLATATGQAYSPPDELVAEADGFARQVIAPEMRQPGVFGAEVAPPAGATPLERVVAFSGRQP
ncbi:MAG: TIGR03086 family metal-binding protein [Acidimicrobiia bacterium]